MKSRQEIVAEIMKKNKGMSLAEASHIVKVQGLYKPKPKAEKAKVVVLEVEAKKPRKKKM